MGVQVETNEAWKAMKEDYGITQEGKMTKNPYKRQSVPESIQRAEKRVQYYVFNVGPWSHRVFAGSLGTTLIPACPYDPKTGVPLAEYSDPIEIPEITLDWANVGEHQLRYQPIDGSVRAREMVSPGGEKENDLRQWGVFYTTNSEPTKEELAQAKAILMAKCNELIQRADFLYEANSPARHGNDPEIASRQMISSKHKMAAKIMNASRPWCVVIQQRTNCLGCGQPADAGVAKHSCGAILDYKLALDLDLITQEKYDRAVAAGRVPGVKPEVTKKSPQA